jgi:hypothetical protein
MHHCLNIGEIVRVIFGLVDAKGDLAALAATCELFRDLALELLWASLDSFAPLIRCLPDDIWSEDSLQQVTESNSLTSSPAVPLLVRPNHTSG